jgi:hypothetical protein
MPILGQATNICTQTMPLAIHLTASLPRLGGDIGRGLAARDTKTHSTFGIFQHVQSQIQKTKYSGGSLHMSLSRKYFHPLR